jgi:hypothetical protein
MPDEFSYSLLRLHEGGHVCGDLAVHAVATAAAVVTARSQPEAAHLHLPLAPSRALLEHASGISRSLSNHQVLIQVASLIAPSLQLHPVEISQMMQRLITAAACWIAVM